MGIDAEILVRVKQTECPTEEQLTRWSWDLCQSIGAEHFFIKDGIPGEEYRVRNEKRLADFRSHPLYAEFQRAEGEQRTETRKKMLEDIGEIPEQRRRALELTNVLYPIEDEEYGLTKEQCKAGRSWLQDGDPIIAEEGEWFLKVSLWARYYGPGYERGDILTICNVAEWLELNIPNCEVWYGGDSSGVLAEPFPHTKRMEYKRHLYSRQGRAYFKSFADNEPFRTPKPCGLCVPNDNRFNRHGWGMGGKYIGVSCAGCGKSFRSEDGGKTWKEDTEGK